MTNRKISSMIKRFTAAGLAVSLLFTEMPSMFAAQEKEAFILGSDITEEELKEALRADEELYPEGRFEFFTPQLTAEEGEKQQLVIVRRGGAAQEATVDFKAVDVSATYGEDYLLTVEESDHVKKTLDGEGKPLTDFNTSQMAVVGDDTEEAAILEDEQEEPDTQQEEKSNDGEKGVLKKQQKSALQQAKDTYLGTESDNLNWQELDDAHKAEAEAQSKEYQQAFDQFAQNILGREYTFTFKEGEYMKSVYIDTIDDETSESDEQVMFLLGNASVGEVSGTNTAYLNIKDNEESEKAVFAMAASEMTVDRSEGVARITVNRVSGVNKIASVIVGTGSMEAVSGTDYKAVQKEVLFAQGVTEQVVEIPLLTYEGAPKSAKFQVALDANSSYVQTGAAVTTVTLTNSEVSADTDAAVETDGDLTADAAAGWSDTRNLNASRTVSGQWNKWSGRGMAAEKIDLSVADYIEVTWKSDEGSRSWTYTTGSGCDEEEHTGWSDDRYSYLYVNGSKAIEKSGAFGWRTDRINLSDANKITNGFVEFETKTKGDNCNATVRVSKVVIHYPGYQFTVSNTAYTDTATGYSNQYTEKIYTDEADALKTDKNGHKYKNGNVISLGTLQVARSDQNFKESVTLYRPCDAIMFRTTYSSNTNSNGVKIKEGPSGNVYLAGYQLEPKNGKTWSKLIAPDDIKLSKEFVNTYKDYLLNGNEFRVRAVYRPYEARVMFQNTDTGKGSYANGFKTNEILRCTTLDTIRVTGIANQGYSVAGFNLGVHKDGNLHKNGITNKALASIANGYYSQSDSKIKEEVKRVSASGYKKVSVSTAVVNAAIGNVVTFCPTGEYTYINPIYSVPKIKVKIDPYNNDKKKGSVVYSEEDSSGNIDPDKVQMGDYQTPMEISGVTLNQEYTINAVADDNYKAYFKNFTGDVNEDGKITTTEEKAVAAYNFVRTASNGNAYTFRPVLDNSLIFYGFLPTVVNRYSGYIDGVVQLRDKPVFGTKQAVKAVNGAQISVAGQTTVSKTDDRFGGVKGTGGDGYFSIGSKDFVAGENQTVNISYNNLHLTATQAVNAAGIYELDAYDTIGINGANAFRVNGDQAEAIAASSISNGDQVYRFVIQTYSKNDVLRAKKAVFRFYRKDGSELDNAVQEVESDNGVFALDFNPATLQIPAGASMTVQFEDQNGTRYFEHEMGFIFAQSLGVLSFLSSFNFGGAEKAIEMVGVIDSAFNFGWDGNVDDIAVNSDDNSTKTISLGFSFGTEKEFGGDDEKEEPDKKEAIKEAAQSSGTTSAQKETQKKAADDAVDKSAEGNTSKAEIGTSAAIEVAFGLEINISKSENPEHLGEWYFKDMTLAATVEGGVDVSIKYMTPIGLPVLIGISSGAAGSATFILEQNYDKKEYYFSDIMDTDAAKIDIFNFNMDSGDRAFDAYGIFTIAPYLDLSAGAGFDFLNLMVGGRADFDMNFYTRSDQTNHGNVTFSAYLSLKVLFFTKKWDIASTTVNMFGSASGLNEFAGNADYTYESLSEMEVDSRSYLKRRSDWKGEDVFSAQSVADTSGITESLLENAVNPNPDIQLTALPNQKYLAVFLDDALEEDTYNCTHVYYSIGDGKTWSEPEMIEKDGTTDDEPAIFDLGSKGIYVAWSSADRLLTEEDTVIDSLNSMNIHGAFFDTTTMAFGTIQEVTKTAPYTYTTTDGIRMSDDTADGQPHISYDEQSNRMLLFYTKTEYESTADDEEGLVGDIAKPYSLMAYRVYDFTTGNWVETYDAAEGLDENYQKAWYGQRFLELAPLALVDEELDGEGYWTKEPEMKKFEKATYTGTDGLTYEQEPIVIESESTTYNGLALYTYVLDYDGDHKTENDRDIFLQIYNYQDNTFTHPIMITTTSDLPESKVKFVRSGDTTLLTYLADNTLYALNLSFIVQYRLRETEIYGETEKFYYIDKSAPPETVTENDYVYMPPMIVAGDRLADVTSGSVEASDENGETQQTEDMTENTEQENPASIVDYDVASAGHYVYAIWTKNSTRVKEGIDPASEEALDAKNRVAESQIYMTRYDSMEGILTEPIQVTDEEGANYGSIAFAVEKGEAGNIKLLATKAKSIVETVEGKDETGTVIKKEILTEDPENKNLMSLEFTPVSTLKVQGVSIDELSAGTDSAVSMELYNDGVETLKDLTLTVQKEDGTKICEQKILSSDNNEENQTEEIYGGQKYFVDFPITLGEEETGVAFTYKISDASQKVLAEGEYSEEIPIQLDITEFEAVSDERGTIQFRVHVANNGRRKSDGSKVWIGRKMEGVEDKYKNITSIETNELLPKEAETYTVDYTYDDYDDMFKTFISDETEDFEAVTSFRAYVNENSESAVDEITMRATKEQRLRMTAIQKVSVLDGEFKEVGTTYSMKKGDITQLNTSVESIAYRGSRYEGTDDESSYDASNTAGLKVMYTSDNEDVLTVYDSGYVEAVGEGTAHVTAYVMPSNNKVIYSAEDGSLEEDNFASVPQEAIIIKNFTVNIAKSGAAIQEPPKTEPVSIGKTYQTDGYFYKVTKLPSGSKAGEVTVTKAAKKTLRLITVKDSVTIGGMEFQVTAIGKGAFKNYKKATQAVIGKNVKVISNNAFLGCKKLKTITISSKKISKVGKKAITNIAKKAVIKVPKSKVKAYKKKFNSKTGYKSTMKIKKK